MKYTSFILLAVAWNLLFTSCGKPPVPTPPYEGVDTSDIIVGFVAFFDGDEIRLVEDDTVVVDSIRIERELHPEPDTSFADYLHFLTRTGNFEQVGLRKSFVAFVGTNAQPYVFYDFFKDDSVKFADTVNLFNRLLAIDTMQFNDAQIAMAALMEDITGMTFWYQDADTVLYTSAAGPQTDSYFKFEQLDSLNTVLEKDAVRFKAKFACKLYGTNGKIIDVTDAYYIGTFRNFE